MTAADDAYKAAQAEIARVADAGDTVLELDKEAFRALDTLPPEIAELAILRTLYLTNTQVSDLAPIAQLANLQDLYLSDTQVSNLAPIAQLANLQTLSLNNTQVSDLAPIAQLENLLTLDLNTTQIADLAPIAQLEELRELSFTNSQVDDLRPCLSHPNLQFLRFRNTPATARDQQLAKLSQIMDSEDRVKQTLAYLRTLPSWPVPLNATPTETVKHEPEEPSATLTAEVLIESQDLAGWRFSPTHGAMELFVQELPTDGRIEALAAMARTRAKKLITALGGRTNQGGLRQAVFEETNRFSDILADEDRPLSVRSLELWGSLIALGDQLDANDRGAREGRDPLDLLSVEARAALSTFLGISAGLVRSFPEARALDDDYGGFQRRTVSVDMVLRLIDVALKAGFVEEKSAALIQHVGAVAQHEGTQGEKASSVSRNGGKNLLFAAAVSVLAASGGVADGIFTDIGSDLSDNFRLGETASDLVKHALDFLTDGSGDAQAFVDALSPDEKARLNAAIADALEKARKAQK